MSRPAQQLTRQQRCIQVNFSTEKFLRCSRTSTLYEQNGSEVALCNIITIIDYYYCYETVSKPAQQMTTEMQSGQCFHRQNCHDVICADVIFSSTGHRMTSLDRQMSHLSDKDKGPRRKCARMQIRHGQHGRRW